MWVNVGTVPLVKVALLVSSVPVARYRVPNVRRRHRLRFQERQPWMTVWCVRLVRSGMCQPVGASIVRQTSMPVARRRRVLHVDRRNHLQWPDLPTRRHAECVQPVSGGMHCRAVYRVVSTNLPAV